jgi:hypothetical protein
LYAVTVDHRLVRTWASLASERLPGVEVGQSIHLLGPGFAPEIASLNVTHVTRAMDLQEPTRYQLPGVGRVTVLPTPSGALCATQVDPQFRRMAEAHLLIQAVQEHLGSAATQRIATLPRGLLVETVERALLTGGRLAVASELARLADRF